MGTHDPNWFEKVITEKKKLAGLSKEDFWRAVSSKKEYSWLKTGSPLSSHFISSLTSSEVYKERKEYFFRKKHEIEIDWSASDFRSRDTRYRKLAVELGPNKAKEISKRIQSAEVQLEYDQLQTFLNNTRDHNKESTNPTIWNPWFLLGLCIFLTIPFKYFFPESLEEKSSRVSFCSDSKRTTLINDSRRACNLDPIFTKCATRIENGCVWAMKRMSYADQIEECRRSVSELSYEVERDIRKSCE